MSQKELSPLTHGEYVLLQDFCRRIPGDWKAALRVDLADGIDMILIHESGLYVLSIVDEPGMVYGSFRDETWMRFRMERPDEPVESPVLRLASGAKALQEMFPNFPVFSFIVYTHKDANVRVTGWEETDTVICKVADTTSFFEQKCAETSEKLTHNQIDMVFAKLNTCSARIPKATGDTGRSETLGDFVCLLKAKSEESKEKEKQKQEKHQDASERKLRWTAAIFCAAALIGLIAFTAYYGNKGSQEIAEHERKLQIVEDYCSNLENEYQELQSKFRVDRDGAQDVVLIDTEPTSYIVAEPDVDLIEGLEGEIHSVIIDLDEDSHVDIEIPDGGFRDHIVIR